MVKVRSLDVSASCHATEDVEKVKKAMLNLVPEDLRKKISFNEQILKGHYGNPIIRLSFKLKGEDAEKTLKHIAKNLDEISRRLLNASLSLRLELPKLYLRFSKQEAYLGKVVLEDSDDIVKVVISFSARRTESLRKYLEEIGLI